jgi:excisionase family DNA binding protein
MDNIDLISIKEVREKLKISKATLWRWITDGKLSVVKLSPRKIYVEKSELERFVQDSKKDRHNA